MQNKAEWKIHLVLNIRWYFYKYLYLVSNAKYGNIMKLTSSNERSLNLKTSKSIYEYYLVFTK